MSLFYLLFVVIILGVIVWAVNAYAPIPAGFKVLVYFICGIIAIFYVLSAFGLMGGGPMVPRIGNG